MRATVPLELALFRRQKAHISRMLEAPSAGFRRYEARYRRRTRRYEAAISADDLRQQVRAADIVYVGDYHTLRSSQEAYLGLVRDVLATGRRVVLALEFVEGRFQAELDAYLARKLPESVFLQRLGLRADAVSVWNGFRPLLAFARDHGLEALAIDRRARGARSLEVRDAYAAARIAKAASAKDSPSVLVLMGQYHVAPCHLPAEVQRALGDTELSHLVVYQNCDDVYWQARAQDAGAEAVRIREGELCLLNASPVLCQQSFLDHVEADPGDALLPPSAVDAAFRRVARLIARQLDVRIEHPLQDVCVRSVADAELMETLRVRAPFSDAELAALRDRLLDRNSCYLPRAKVAYLASLSLSHAAEEAAHFVRHACIGDAMDRERPHRDAFYARCLEEALGFVGSRLVHPDRPCDPPSVFASKFEHGRGREKAIAAYVLAHVAVRDGASLAPDRLVPSDLHVFDGASHAVGYLLGDAMDAALRTGRLTRSALRELFCDRFDDAEARYFELVHALRRRPPKKIPAPLRAALRAS